MSDTKIASKYYQTQESLKQLSEAGGALAAVRVLETFEGQDELVVQITERLKALSAVALIQFSDLEDLEESNPETEESDSKTSTFAHTNRALNC